MGYSQKNEFQSFDGPGKSVTDRYGRIAKPVYSRHMDSGSFLHQALLFTVQKHKPRSSYVPPPEGPASPGLTAPDLSSLCLNL